MAISKEKIICPAPFINVSYKASVNGFRICCVIKGWHRYPNKKPQEGLAEYWHSVYLKNLRAKYLAGIWPAECIRCRKQEEQGGSKTPSYLPLYQQQ